MTACSAVCRHAVVKCSSVVEAAPAEDCSQAVATQMCLKIMWESAR